jgi:hypothetical protein
MLYGAFCVVILFFVPRIYPTLRWTHLTTFSLALFGFVALAGRFIAYAQ